MPDLLVITPSRGRPQNAARLIKAIQDTARLDTWVFFGIDEDDPERENYQRLMLAGQKTFFRFRPRMNLTEWTNELALEKLDDFPYLASLGDDMVPRSKGWDKALVNAVRDMGGTGFAYPWDGIREDIPEAVVMSSDIVRALGWMALPVCQHFWIDDAWGELGANAGCIRHLRTVKIDHLHPAKDGAPSDSTYGDARKKISADEKAYHHWRVTQMPADAQVILKLRESKLK